MKLSIFLMFAFIFNHAIASQGEDVSSFLGDYSLKKSLAGKCYQKASVYLPENKTDVLSIVQLFISNDGVNETEEMRDNTIINEIGVADFEIGRLNSLPKISPLRDGLAGYTIGTTKESYSFKQNELSYVRRDFSGIFLPKPSSTIDVKATMKGDLLTLVRQEFYPHAAGGPIKRNTHCIFEKR